ncbi:beta-1,3-galactosyltransferase 4 [Mixophyes fleayi]|uniref:beta-1,3-galactosyltransferase 4 n=1 Tax=Mixophyes fleayi TaxID=3061075 RepID=UPI003F4E3451
MLPAVAACLRLFPVYRRRWRVFVTVISLALLIIFLISGHLEEHLSWALPIFYSAPSHLSSSPILNVPVPPFLLSPVKACLSPPLLLILVSSAPSHRDRRDAIRQTWGSLSSSTEFASLTLFVLGVPKSPVERAALVHEAVTHRDIIQANFTDSYQNLTLKTLTGLSWALEKCQEAQYLLKTDDDVFVNTPSLSKFLREHNGLMYLGRVHWHVSPDRDPESRHYTSYELYAGDHFPPYCSGTGYVLSQAAARHLLQEAGSGPWPTVEDVYVGILARAAGIAPRHIAKIAGSIIVPHNSCCYRTMFTSHRITPRRMQEAWYMLKEADNHWCPPLTLLYCKLMGQGVENGDVYEPLLENR